MLMHNHFKLGYALKCLECRQGGSCEKNEIGKSVKCSSVISDPVCMVIKGEGPKEVFYLRRACLSYSKAKNLSENFGIVADQKNKCRTLKNDTLDKKLTSCICNIKNNCNSKLVSSQKVLKNQKEDKSKLSETSEFTRLYKRKNAFLEVNLHDSGPVDPTQHDENFLITIVLYYIMCILSIVVVFLIIFIMIKLQLFWALD